MQRPSSDQAITRSTYKVTTGNHLVTKQWPYSYQEVSMQLSHSNNVVVMYDEAKTEKPDGNHAETVQRPCSDHAVIMQ